MASEPAKKPVVIRRIGLKKRFFYALARPLVNVFFMLFYRVRYFGKWNIPDDGPLLIVSNHQSLFDPPLIGGGVTRRQCNYLARKTLFKFRPFAWLIDLYDAIPLDNEGIGYEGIKETLRRLKAGEVVLLFPEGARTWDGEIQPLKPGFITLALRSRATILPTALVGCYEAWPRTHKYPWPFGRIRVIFGEPIDEEQARSMSEDELHRLVEDRIRMLYNELLCR